MSVVPDEFIISINLTNLNTFNSGSNNNVFSSVFSQSIQLDDWKIALVNLYMFNCFQNVTKSYGNNAFSYTFFNGSTTLTRNVVLPDGIYSIDDLGNFLKYTMTENGDYLYNTTTLQSVFPLSLQSNATYYGAQLTSMSIDTTQYPTASGWIIKNGGSIPISTVFPQFIVPSPSGFNSNTFGSLIGYPAGSFPPTTYSASYSNPMVYISGGGNATPGFNGFVPEISPLQAIQINCSTVINPFSSNPNMVYTFTTLNTSAGEMISIVPPYLSYQNLGKNLRVSQLDFFFTDQNNNALKIIDPNLSITLSMKRFPESSRSKDDVIFKKQKRILQKFYSAICTVK